MYKAVKDFLSIPIRYSKRKTILIFCLSALASLSASLGFILLVPLLEVLQDKTDFDNSTVSFIADKIGSLGFPITTAGLLIAFVFMIALQNVLMVISNQLSGKFNFEMLDDLRLNCFRALLNANWKWLSTSKKSDHSNLLLNDVDRISSGISASISLVTASITALIYIFSASLLSWKMTLIALAIGLVLSLFLRAQHQWSLSYGDSFGDAQEDLQEVVEEGLAGIKLTKILGNEQQHVSLMGRIMETMRNEQLSFVKLSSVTGAVYQIIAVIILAFFLYTGIEFLSLPIATLLVLVVIFSRLIPLFRSIQSQINNIFYEVPAYRNYTRKMQQAELHFDKVSSKETKPLALKRGIEVSNLVFEYADRDANPIDGLNLFIPAQKTTAFMGASGSGKSTFADLLMGLLVPTSGLIKIDGQTITDANRNLWRQSVAYVPQDVFLFHDTIRKNLLWALPDATETELKTALKKAAAEFVFELPKGLETIVGDRGLMLSGGERQRIALARAMLRKPSLLILDEATSALDVQNEKRIRDSIERMHGNLTVLVIGHRLPTLESADQVVVLEKGRISALGSWADVMDS